MVLKRQVALIQPLYMWRHAESRSTKAPNSQAGGGGSPTVDQPGNDLITKKGLAGDS